MLRFKVGEKVKVVGNTSQHHFELGKIVTIEALYSDSEFTDYLAAGEGG